MRRSGLRHTLARLAPGLPSVVALDHTPAIARYSGPPPHLRSRQIMRAARDRPYAAAHFRIEGHPICRVHPRTRDSVGCTGPTRSPILAAKRADIGVRDENPLRVERVEVHAVISSH